MFFDYNISASYVQVSEHRENLSCKFYLASNENSNGDDKPESPSGAPESTSEAIFEAANNPGGGFGGDR